ncbi:MAG: DUF5655 domain-containing protein [Acidimicrobiia bacterium]|nr:DUF5655 domain-containing protein [Acidimicrobiia bacterium]
MDRWTCPECRRDFGKRGQSHMCSPGLGVDEYFATAQPWERPIFEVVANHLESLGDVIIDPIAIGVLFKNGPMLCELRAMKRWTALGFHLDRQLVSGRLSRKVVEYGNKFWHVVNVESADQIDGEIVGWLTEAYHVAGGTLDTMSLPAEPGTGADPMVPDDVEDLFG